MSYVKTIYHSVYLRLPHENKSMNHFKMSPFKISLLLSYVCIASISAAIITPALPQIESSFALKHGSLEWSMSIFLLGSVIGQLIYGPIANRFGRLFSLRIGLIINLIGIILCIASVKLSNYGLLLFGRFITALGAAAGLSCTFTLINELLCRDQAKRAMSFAIVSFTVGIGAAVSIGGTITQHMPWHYCFICLLIHGLLMFILTWQFPETLKEKIALHPLKILSGYQATLRQSQLVVFSMIIGLVSAVAYGYSSAAPLYAQSVLHLSPASYGYWNLINTVGMLASGFFSAYIMKKYGPARLLYIGLIGMAPCLVSLCVIAITQQSSAIWFFMTTMFLYLFSGVLFPAASFFASNAIKDKANASSMMSFINMGSAMMTVAIIGYLPMSSIKALATAITAFFVIITLLLLPYLLKDHKQNLPTHA